MMSKQNLVFEGRRFLWILWLFGGASNQIKTTYFYQQFKILSLPPGLSVDSPDKPTNSQELSIKPLEKRKQMENEL